MNMKMRGWLSWAVSALMAACIGAQTPAPTPVTCTGCALSWLYDQADMPDGVTIKVDWNTAAPGVCDATECKGSACDFTSVRVTVVNDSKTALWAIDGDWHAIPALMETTWGYQDEPIDCGGGHRVRLYLKDDQTGPNCGATTLKCTECESPGHE